MWRLLPNLCACVSSEKVILLDVRGDRYLTLQPKLGDMALGWMLGAAGAPPPDRLVAALQTAGILHVSDPPLSNRVSPDISIPRQLGAAPRKRATAGDVAGVAAAVIRSWIAIRTIRFGAIIAQLEARRAEGTDGEAQGRALRFAAARTFVPVARNCLLDSLAMDHWLGRSRRGRTLVFGVTATPFAAHCWLQSQDAVLNDSFDRVSRFTPILAI